MFRIGMENRIQPARSPLSSSFIDVSVDVKKPNMETFNGSRKKKKEKETRQDGVRCSVKRLYEKYGLCVLLQSSMPFKYSKSASSSHVNGGIRALKQRTSSLHSAVHHLSSPRPLPQCSRR